MRLLHATFCLGFLFAGGCVTAVAPNLTHPVDATEQRLISVSEAAAKLGLEVKEGAMTSELVMFDAVGNEVSVYARTPKKYAYNRVPRAVEDPYIQYDEEGELYMPIGMYNSICKDMGLLDRMIQGEGVKIERPFRNQIRLDVPNPDEAVRRTETTREVKPQPARALAASLTGWRIVVDAGHGGRDPGGIGVGGVIEKDIALNSALKLKANLEKEGATVIMTRSDDTFVELAERAEIANRLRADLFISIHANIGGTESAGGIETWYQAGEERGRLSGLLAEAVNRNMVVQSKAVDRGARADQRGLRVLRSTNMPAVLLELGFMSNGAEAKRLVESSYQDKLIAGVLTGVKEYAGAQEKIRATVAR